MTPPDLCAADEQEQTLKQLLPVSKVVMGRERGTNRGEFECPLMGSARLSALGAYRHGFVICYNVPLDWFAGILAMTLISKSKPASHVTPTAVQFG